MISRILSILLSALITCSGLACTEMLYAASGATSSGISTQSGITNTPSGTGTTRKITVKAEPRSGTYSGSVIVVLTANDPKAKIWYVLDPNAHPGEAMPYKKPIHIEKDTPVLFFAYINEQVETKIMQENYHIVSNLQTSDNGTLIAGTPVAPPTATISPKSPALMAVKTEIKKPKTPIVETKTSEVAVTQKTSTGEVIPTSITPAPTETIAPVSPESPSSYPSALKASASESSNQETLPYVAAILAALIAGIAGIRLYTRFRKG